MKSLLNAIISNIWWILLWYFLSLAMVMEWGFTGKSLTISVILAIAIIVIINKDNDPRKTPFS